MNDTNLILETNVRWNRKILNAYWMVIVLSLGVEIINMFLSDQNRGYFFLRFILTPTAGLVFVVLIAEAWVRYIRTAADYALLLAADAMADVLVAVHSTVPLTTATVILPLLISAFYFEPKKVVYTAVISFLSLFGLYWFIPELHTSLDPVDLVTILAVLVGGSFICIQLMHRGIEMLAKLRSSLETNQDLMIQKILMESVSKLDGLTETYNHKSFHQHLDDLIRQSEKAGSSIHLVLYDIDNFKSINDTYGHHIGDIILRRVAQIIKGQVGLHDFVARYGGEEFAVILVDRTDSQAEFIAEHICETVSSLHHSEIDGHVTVSGGLAKYLPGQGKEHLFTTADGLLYAAKNEGKNQVLKLRGA